MNWRDITRGMTVYHRTFTHLGPGVVKGVVSVNFVEAMFERGTKRVLVDWETRRDTQRCYLSDLRKTPNRQKIRSMVELYRQRGQTAIDGGDRLVLPNVDDQPR